MNRFSLICCILLLNQFFCQSNAQTAYLQSNQVFAGDIAELVIELDSKIPALYSLDTSVLQQDFEVLEIRSGVSRVFESNEQFHRMRWKIEILPRRNGKLKIPSLRVGEVSTAELTLQVTAQSPELSAKNRVWVELQTRPESPYIGQHTQVIVRVFHNIPLFDGDLIEPQAEGTEIYRNGIDSRYTVSRDGEQFDVLERSLILVAQSSGETGISPAIYRGIIKSSEHSSTPGTTTESRRISRASETLMLPVRNPPPGFSGDIWLPARRLELEGHWDEFTGRLSVGDSLGLNLSIEARGLAAESLPTSMLSTTSDKIKVYADQAVRSNRYEGQEFVGRLEQRYAIIVTQPGEIEIPAITLKWWNLDRETETVAQLPGRKWSATIASPGQARQGDNAAQSHASDALLSARADWQWYWLVAAALFGLALLICIGPLRNRINARIEFILARSNNRRSLKLACLSNDPASARSELLKWGRACWPDVAITGLHHLDSLTSSHELAAEFYRLDEALYAQHSQAWQGRRLWQLITAGKRQFADLSERDEASLPDLYPQQI